MSEVPELPSRFVFVVWIRDLDLPPADQDHEWPAVFAIEAVSAEAAKSWGDTLASRYAARTNQEIIRSEIDGAHPGTGLPVVVENEFADDAHIGW